MPTRRFVLALVALITVVSSLNFHPATAHDVPELKKVDCKFEIPATDLKIDCYMFTVPEDRNDMEHAHIELAVSLIHSRSANPELDPVIYLHGGPGGNAVADTPNWLDSPILDKRDLILLDQRGAGYSEPGLFCPPPEEATPTRVKQSIGVGNPPDDMGEVERCKKTLTDQGIKLAAYNTRESAIDVHMLREAFGYKQWNVYGISYGTKLALTVARDFPVGVRTLIIDGVYPPEVNSIEEDGKWTLNALETLFKNCAANESCNKAYPDLKNTFYQLIGKLNTEPAKIDYEDGTYDLSGSEVYSRVVQLMYDENAIPLLPKTMVAMSKGEYTALDDLEAKINGDGADTPEGKSVRRQDNQGEQPDYSDSEGDYNSVECADEILFNNKDKALASVNEAPEVFRDAIRDEINNYFDTCRIWGVPASDAVENKRVESPIPALIFSGEYDPVTPKAWADSAAQGLPNSFSFLFAGTGHGQMSECADSIIVAFLDDPKTKPNGDCTELVSDPEFETK